MSCTTCSQRVSTFTAKAICLKGEASWEECGDWYQDYDQFLQKRSDFLAQLPAAEKARLSKLSNELRDEMSDTVSYGHDEGAGDEACLAVLV